MKRKHWIAVIILLLIAISLYVVFVSIDKEQLICVLSSSKISKSIEINEESLLSMEKRDLSTDAKIELEIAKALIESSKEKLENMKCDDAVEDIRKTTTMVWLLQNEIYPKTSLEESSKYFEEAYGLSRRSLSIEVKIDDIDCDEGTVTIRNIKNQTIESHHVIVYNDGEIKTNENEIEAYGSLTFEFQRAFVDDVKTIGPLGNLTIHNCG